MIRRILKWLLVLLILAAAGFFIFGPGIAERGMNKVAAGKLPPISERVRALHARLAIADMHADTLLWNRDLLDAAGAARSICLGSRKGMSPFRCSRR